MYIIDYKTNPYKSDVLTEQKDTKEGVLHFVLNHSIDHSQFKVLRINKYENGHLAPLTVQIDHNMRISLEELKEDRQPQTQLQAQRGELF